MSSDTSEYVTIEKDWDLQPHLGDDKGHHVIRVNERKLLVDFMFRRVEGSLLISGKRGVGKTSAVFSAVNAIVKKSTDKKIVPVLVIAPTFELYDGESPIKPEKFQEFKELIFQTLIRRLYRPKRKELKKFEKDIKKLYKKAVAKKVTQTIREEESSFEKVKTESKTTTTIDPKITAGVIGSIIAG